jgi:hypothetical protein
LLKQNMNIRGGNRTGVSEPLEETGSGRTERENIAAQDV